MKFKSIVAVSAYLFLGLSTVLFYSSCEGNHDHDGDHEHEHDNDHESADYQQSKNAEANLKLVNDYMAALLADDGETVKSSVSEGFKVYGPAAQDSATAIQTIENWKFINSTRTNQDFGIFAQNALTVNNDPYVGEWVNLWGNYSGTHTESGTDLALPWHAVYRIEEGKIVMSVVFFDQLSGALALGQVSANE